MGKILFITSPFGGLPHGMVNTLKRMDVDYIETPFWNMHEAYKQFNPQIVIFFHHFLKNWDEATIKEVEKITCHKIYWDWELPWEIDYITKYHHFFSFVFGQDKNSIDYLKDTTGDRNKFIFVPHAADKSLADPINVPFEYRSDLCFIGAAYPSRLKFFREVLPHLTDYKIVIGGTGWEFLPDALGQKIINTGVGEADYIKYIKGTKIALNLHRLSDEVPMANASFVKASSPNNRFFEINMLGAFQITDDVRMPELQEYYLPTLPVFNNPQHFINMFKEFVDNHDVMFHQETINRHSYENRFTEIISKVI